MARPFKKFLSSPRIYCCANCRCHSADHDDIISKAFQGRHGRAFLFNNAVNITLGPKEERTLLTGLHTVADIKCSSCDAVLGWKYETASDEAQKYKEGKFIIEKARVMKCAPCRKAIGNKKDLQDSGRFYWLKNGKMNGLRCKLCRRARDKAAKLANPPAAGWPARRPLPPLDRWAPLVR